MSIIMAAVLLLAPTSFVEPPPLTEIATTAEASAPAVRVDPPTHEEATLGSSTSSGGRCIGWEPLLQRLSPGWDVARMSRIMYRESRCQPGARNSHSSATGLLQILSSHCPWLADVMGTWCSRDRLTGPEYNVRAGATLWREQSYGAWSTS